MNVAKVADGLPAPYRRRAWLAIGFALVVLVVILSLGPPPAPLPGVDYSDKFGHVLAYGVLMSWFAQLYWDWLTRWRIAAALTLLGVVLEFLQGLTPARPPEVADMVANAAGIGIALLVARPPIDRLMDRIDQAWATVR